jgi:voltage-gated potassium channel Kch
MLAYQGIHFFNPKAFSNVTGKSSSPANTVDLVYFSFATLTTLGYGDITPISKLARMIAVTEAMVGQIYLTARDS